MVHFQHRYLEKAIAVASFITAVVFAFTALILNEQHEILAGNCTVIAQFLLLTASLFGIDYKLNSIGHTIKHHYDTKRNTQPQPAEHSQGE